MGHQLCLDGLDGGCAHSSHVLMKLSLQEPRGREPGGLEGVPVGLPNAVLDGVFPLLALPARPAPDRVGSAPAGRVARDYYLRGAQAERGLMWPQTLPRLPREGLKTLPAEKSGPQL